MGHAAVYLYFDLLQRRFRDMGHETRCVRNVTDVDDEHPAQGSWARGALSRPGGRGDGAIRCRNGTAPTCCPSTPSREGRPRPSPKILSLIGVALDTGHAYEAGGVGVLRHCDVSGLRPIVSGYDRTHMLELAAEHGGNPERPLQAEPTRLCALAAVVARRAGAGVTLGAWSARHMAHRVLGAGVTRTGGDWSISTTVGVVTSSSLTMNVEAAQSESVTGQPFVRVWFPRGPGRLGRLLKMSKSLGNLVFVGEASARSGSPRPSTAGHARPSLPPGLGLGDQHRHAGRGRPAGPVEECPRWDRGGGPGRGPGCPR